MHEGLALASTSHFYDFVGTYGYMGIFIWFLIFDQFIPIPDEIPLLTIGFLFAQGVFRSPLLAIVVSAAAFLAIDVLYFFFTRSGSKLVKKITGKKSGLFLRYQERMKRAMPKTLLGLIFIPRMRVFGPILCASVGVPFRTFVIFDAIGVTCFASIYITLGILFHASLERLFSRVQSFENLAFGIIILIILFAMLFFARRRHKKDTSVPTA